MICLKFMGNSTVSVVLPQYIQKDPKQPVCVVSKETQNYYSLIIGLLGTTPYTMRHMSYVHCIASVPIYPLHC